MQAGTDDIIPLSAPMTLPNGQTTDHVFVAAGQHVAVPIITVNRMKSLWGEDGYEVRRGRAPQTLLSTHPVAVQAGTVVEQRTGHPGYRSRDPGPPEPGHLRQRTSRVSG
jgi:hypothetical protein